mgnify:CR=1 FL=1
MPTAQMPIPINGYSDSLNHQHGADGFSTSMMNVVPMDNFEHRRRIGTRQGFAAVADMGVNNDLNVQCLLEYEVYRDTSLLREVLIVAGGSVFYADSDGNTHDIAYSTAAATATVTFTGTPTTGKTLTIVPNDVGAPDTIVATVIDTGSTTTGDDDTPSFLNTGADTDAHATALATCLDGNAHLNASASGSVVTITQEDAGSASSTGNTDITGNLDNATITNFSGAAYAAGQNRIHPSDTVRAAMYGTVVYLVTGRQYYKIDLSATTPVIEEWTNYNGTGGMPTDAYGNKCNLITRFGARIVMAGISSSPNNWFMSKIGDAEDWTPTALSSSDAQAGDSSTEFGVLGEPITAIFPFGEAGLMMASKGTLTYLTADPVTTGAQMIRMSNGVGVMGPDAWCQGPEKSCYVASGDGVYLIQPNQFNIQRGQSITTGRLDGFFSGVNSSEVDLHLAYDPPRGTILLFVNREADPLNVVHYMHHIATQSWWTFKVSDPRMDVVRTTCLYSPISGEREGLWIGCKSGRITTQPNSGVLAYDGGSHTSPLKSASNNSPDDAKETFESRIAWAPINAGLSNQRLLMTELDVLLDRNEVTATDGITPAGPTLNLYGAEMAQILSGVSGDIKVTQTELVIDGGVATLEEGSSSPYSPSAIIDTGNADAKAYAVITVADGDAIDHGIAELQYITITSTAGVTKTYVVTDTNAGGVATGTVLAEGSDYGSGTIPADHALIGGIAVGINTTGSVSNAYTYLVQLKAAINHANGHNAGGSSVFTFVDPAAGAAANGAQSLRIIQAVDGRGGNRPITETIASSVTIPSVFVGGQSITAVGTEYRPAVQATISLHDSSISNLNNETIVLNDLASGTSAVTLTFDSSLGVNASTASSIGCADANGNLLAIMKGVKKSIDLNYQAGLLNIKTEDPYLDSSEAKMVLRMSDNWNGLDLLTGLTLTGTAIDSNDIQDETFALEAGANWKQFINGGSAADVTGTYTLNDSASSDSMKKWSRSNSYTVRMGGNTSASESSNFDGRWAVFGAGDNAPPLYMADEETASLSLSTWNSVEILPSNFTASSVIVDPTQDATTKRLLQSWTLNRGRNNRFRVRKRESDFQVEITASGTMWVLEDLAISLEQGGPYRSVIAS